MTEHATGAPVPRLDDFDPFTPAFRADPYPAYRRIREMGGPVLWDYLESYLVARHTDVTSVLADPRIQVEPAPEVAELMAAMVPESLAPMQRTMLFRDPPEHGRLRGLVRKAFTGSGLHKPLAAGRETAARALARATEEGTFEVVSQFAFPVSVQVIGDILGVPREDLDDLRAWGQALSPAADIPPGPEALDLAIDAYERFDDYFDRLVAERRRNPREDLLTGLIQAQERGQLTRSELHATATLVFVSGHETLMILMSNAVLTLLRHPDQLALLRQRPELAGNAVEELLRFESPLQLATAGGGRWAREDIEIGGRVIPAGSRILTLIGAANRDPAVYPDPDRFDVARTVQRPLSLGHGLHFCVGAVLARAEGRMAIEELARWEADLELTEEEPQWLPLFIQRRLGALPIKVRAR
ncbi:cytochrome P450 [Actinomadura sp. KC216]|uniref:cytochrome P450 n=1 Tax=Actinomadura sp. KC216 TaxID=2530370 RepID=UPI0010453E2B|nr:cytochrome P450 [Actinomadura sp. KC216]TDB85801.1 cytochrome P450 [Actinomadura sp. KC216]